MLLAEYLHIVKVNYNIVNDNLTNRKYLKQKQIQYTTVDKETNFWNPQIASNYSQGMA